MKRSQTIVSTDIVHKQPRSGVKSHLFDVRSRAEYADGHSAGTVSIPKEQRDAVRARQVLGHYARAETTLNLVCASGLPQAA